MFDKSPILYLEDNPEDAELVQILLNEAHIFAPITVVETEEDFLREFDTGNYHLIISDYSLPSYDGLKALGTVRDRCIEVPFIFLSGVLGEDAAIEGLSRGATDYVMKHKISRLAPAVQRALEEFEKRQTLHSTQQALQRSQRYFQAIFETMRDAIIIFDSTGRFLEANPAATLLTGYAHDELLNLMYDDIILPTEQSEWRSRFHDFLDEGFSHGEYCVAQKDGGVICMEYNAVANFIPRFHLSILRDVSEREHSQKVLMESEELLQLFFAQSLDGFFFMMMDEPIQWDESVDKEETLEYVFSHERITKVNDAMLLQYGARREDMIGRTPRDFFEHNIDHGKNLWRECLDKGRLHTNSDERRLDGTQIWIEGDYLCLYDDDGRIRGHFGVQREITEKKRAEDELHLVHHLTMALNDATDFESALRIVIAEICEKTKWVYAETWVPDETREALTCSPAWFALDPTLEKFRSECLRLTFHEGEGLPGKTWTSKQACWISDVTIDPDFLRKDIAKEFDLKSALAVPILVEAEIEAVMIFFLHESHAKDVQQVELITTVAAQLGALFQRKKAEEQLRKSEERFRLLVETARDAIYTISMDGIFTSLNRAFEDITGWNRFEWIGKNFAALVIPTIMRSPWIFTFASAVANKSIPTKSASGKTMANTSLRS